MKSKGLQWDSQVPEDLFQAFTEASLIHDSLQLATAVLL